MKKTGAITALMAIQILEASRTVSPSDFELMLIKMAKSVAEAPTMIVIMREKRTWLNSEAPGLKNLR